MATHLGRVQRVLSVLGSENDGRRVCGARGVHVIKERLDGLVRLVHGGRQLRVEDADAAWRISVRNLGLAEEPAAKRD